jgi:hypothetical protein
MIFGKTKYNEYSTISAKNMKGAWCIEYAVLDDF